MATIAEALAAALRFQQAGDNARAEQIYRQVLKVEPHNPEALHFLGMLGHQAGNHEAALEQVRRALTFDPLSAVIHNNLGLIHGALGQRDESVACYRRALRLLPGSHEICTNLANALKEGGDTDEAVAFYRRALALRPDLPEMHNNLGSALRERGRLDEALAEYHEALRLRPDFAEALNNLGIALQDQGKLDEAVARYQEALRRAPRLPQAHSNLGAALRLKGRLDEAADHCRQALLLRPAYAEAHYNLANTLADQERFDEAVPHYQEVVRLKPEHAEAYNGLGNALRRQGKLDEAMLSYRRALKIRPEFAEASANLGTALAEQGRMDEAVACLRHAAGLMPDEPDVRASLGGVVAEQGHAREAETYLQEALRLRPGKQLRIQLATLLPPLYRSLEDMHSWRRRLVDNLRQLLQDGVSIDLTKDTSGPLFYLAYQGQNDRDVQRDLARLSVPPPDVPPQGGAGPKLRVGFLSRCLRDHTIGHLNAGMICALSRQKFSVSVLSLGSYKDSVAQLLREKADEYVELPQKLEDQRQAVRDQRLDVLVYTDIGMEQSSYTLAFSRLAPVQCVTWGHPVTTGITTVDYFLSSELLEAEEADEHYTETLARLPTMSVYYQRPALPEPRPSRAELGLPADGHLYCCLQSLFKFHPEFDPVLVGILQRDPQGVLVLLHSWNRSWEEILLRRLEALLPWVRERVCFVAPRPRPEFIALEGAADVMLDPLHFGGGNTSYEALASEVPIVTLPSRLLRGRITLALYRKMGLSDCVVNSPAEYVDLAVRLGTDADHRRAVRARIAAASEALYEDRQAVRDLEDFLEEAVSRARSQGGE